MDTLEQFKQWVQGQGQELEAAIRSSADRSNPIQKHAHEMQLNRLCTALNLIDEFKQMS